MEEYREKKMDKKKAKKPIDQNYFHGTNKYTNGSRGYLSVFFVFVFFPLRNVTHLKKTPRKTEGCAYQDIVRILLEWDSIFKTSYSLS